MLLLLQLALQNHVRKGHDTWKLTFELTATVNSSKAKAVRVFIFKTVFKLQMRLREIRLIHFIYPFTIKITN
jgi:hypothetical protein